MQKIYKCMEQKIFELVKIFEPVLYSIPVNRYILQGIKKNSTLMYINLCSFGVSLLTLNPLNQKISGHISGVFIINMKMYLPGIFFQI